MTSIIFTLINYKIKNFGSVSIDELFFYFFNGIGGANTAAFYPSLLKNLIPFVVIFFILVSPSINIVSDKMSIIINFKTKKKNHRLKINPAYIQKKCLIAYILLAFISSIASSVVVLDLYNYIIAKNTSSNLFQDNYIDTKNIHLEFPDKKRNVIHIYLESMENSLLSKKNGGNSSQSVTPELEEIALDSSTLFSKTNNIGGLLPVYGTTWTVGGMVAQSSGVPILNIDYDINDLGKFNKFLPGVYSLGEILKKEGYYQEIMMGSEASFGGRDKYYQQHGDYKIFDLNTAKSQGKIPNDYFVWWGFEDKKLFEYAKEELSSIVKTNQPFNFELLTADSHFIDGYLDPSCAIKFDNQYKNVYACSSKQVSDFINWIKEQDFYKDTTIIITGDHLGMQTSFYEGLSNDNYERTIYSAIINSAKEPVNKVERKFSSLDLFPTTLSSMGVTIEGDRLGLGVDLFSDKKTLIENYGIDYVNLELQKRSVFYNSNIFYPR